MKRFAVLVLAGCLAPDATGDGGTNPGGDGGTSGSVTVTITAPSSGATVHRDYLYMDGRWVARVTFTAKVTGGSPSSVEWMVGGLVRGEGVPPDYAFTTNFYADGPQAFDAVVHGAHDAELGRASVALTVAAPTADQADCPTQLGVLGVQFTSGPTTMGIANPITMSLPLKGMNFTAGGTTSPRANLLMDCAFALSLWRFVDVLQARHVTGVVDGGLYKYRCVSGTEQPPCPTSGLSQHALGLALDIQALKIADGTTLVVADDWQVDTLASGQTTCTVVPAGTLRNQELHSIVCDIWETKTFGVLLTPNYRPTQTFIYFDIMNPFQPIFLQ
jgi:hypothetical protein